MTLSHRTLRRSRLAALALGFAALVAPVAAAAQTAEATVDRAVAAWKRARTVRAQFEQQVTNPLTGSAETARGTYHQQGTGRLSVRFTQPKGDAIVADGQALWLYLPSSAPGQVIRTAPGSAGAADFTAQFLASPRTRYAMADGGRAMVDGRAARAVVLTPRANANAPFTRAKVWVDDADAMIRQFEVVDANGLTRRVRLSGLTVNAPIDAKVFTFTAPKGVRVVQQ